MSQDWWFVPTADGSCRLWVRESGEGDPIVWLHGGPGYDCEYLSRAQEGIAGRHILYCQRGSLHSPAPIEKISAAAHVDDLEQLRITLGVDRLTLVGHSWGTLLAMLYLANYPEQTGRLVLIGAHPPRGPASIDWGASEAFVRRPEIEAQIRAEGLDEESTSARTKSLTYRIREAGRKMYRIERWRQDRPGFYNRAVAEATASTLAPFDVTKELAQHSFPVTVIIGEFDYTDMGASLTKKGFGLIPGVKVHVLRQAGHDAWHDDPTGFREVMRSALYG